MLLPLLLLLLLLLPPSRWSNPTFNCPPLPPAVGKSTLLTELTGTASEAAGYEFTT